VERTFTQNKIGYIINGGINSVNPNFQSVHKELEIGFKENTFVEESNNRFSTIGFSNNFISFDEASKCTNGTIFGKFFKFHPVIFH